MFIWDRKGGQNKGRYHDILIFNIEKEDQHTSIITVVMNSDGDEIVHKTGLYIIQLNLFKLTV